MGPELGRGAAEIQTRVQAEAEKLIKERGAGYVGCARSGVEQVCAAQLGKALQQICSIPFPAMGR